MKNAETSKKIIEITDNYIKVNGRDFKLSDKRTSMLLYLIKNPGNHSYESVIEHIGSITSNANVVIKQLTKDINEALFDGYGYVAKRDTGTVSFVDIKESYIELSVNVEKEESLPHILTKSSPMHISKKQILHREEDIEYLLELLSGKEKQSLALTGFGGVGKTTLARYLYSKMDGLFESRGWIEYNGNIKFSILSSFDLYDEISDLELRWNKIINLLTKCKGNCVLFIDNVIKNSIHNQDPLTDIELHKLSGIPNLSIVLTTRLDDLKGYNMIDVDVLEPGKAVDVFYYYYDRREYSKDIFRRKNRETVKKLVELANYHTFVLELMGKSAKYIPLDEFYEKMVNEGFSFPTLKISTDYSQESDVVSKQLKILFDINSRTVEEQKVLWDFAILPNISLSLQQVVSWLGYDENLIDSLVKEGWLQYNDGFVMHDLIKSTIIMDLDEGYAPAKTLDIIIENVVNKKYFLKSEDYSISKRKYDILKSAEKYLRLNDISFGRLKESLGYCSFYKLSDKNSALIYYEDSKKFYSKLYEKEGKNYLKDLVSIHYDIGYLLSSMDRTHYSEAERYLKEALRLSEESDEPNKEKVASIQDHLGYVLTISGSDRHVEAETMLRKSLAAREILYDESPTRYAFDLATTQDNLGYLLSHMDNGNHQEALKLLFQAMNLRKDLNSRFEGVYLSEVSWTVNNLADLMTMMGKYDEAEQLYLEAISLRMELDDKNPGVYLSNIAWSYCCLAQCVEKNPSRCHKSNTYYEKALSIYKKLEKEEPGIYLRDIEKVEEYLRGEAEPSLKSFIGNQTHINN